MKFQNHRPPSLTNSKPATSVCTFSFQVPGKKNQVKYHQKIGLSGEAAPVACFHQMLDIITYKYHLNKILKFEIPKMFYAILPCHPILSVLLQNIHSTKQEKRKSGKYFFSNQPSEISLLLCLASSDYQKATGVLKEGHSLPYLIPPSVLKEEGKGCT